MFDVGAGAAAERIGSGAARQGVVALAAAEDVVAGAAGRGCRCPCRRRAVGPVAAGDRVDAVAAAQDVGAAEAGQGVVALAATIRSVPSVPVKRLVGVRADLDVDRERDGVDAVAQRERQRARAARLVGGGDRDRPVGGPVITTLAFGTSVVFVLPVRVSERSPEAVCRSLTWTRNEPPFAVVEQSPPPVISKIGGALSSSPTSTGSWSDVRYWFGSYSASWRAA